MCIKNVKTRNNKYKISNGNFAKYQYRVDVQGYEVIEVDMYI
jgi:hypothetical protein